ncbi:methyl-accepting chemotaxis protein [Amphibacillus cookii]|uniref:methyl-accepting chemotaxis protein n=1 Tax=Amphibacillus cookii TaxID=767787 RepID=UPI0019571511|nr:methyl-accepting chemotaxis protein [Amphibacillus cookii]MBM7542184.1 methyl-accepting chemotaxis protein [Amphibacillus cookii]
MTHKKIPFWKRLHIHAITILVIVLLINTTLSGLLLNLIEMTGIELGLIGQFLNGFMNIIVATILISLFINYYIIKPIQTMEQKIYQFQQGDYSVRVNTKNFNEIGVLSHGLNEMFTQIEQHQNDQQTQIDFVENKSQTISDKVDHLTKEMRSMNKYFDDISNSALEQLSTFEETSAVTDNMNEQFQGIAQHITELTESFNKMRTSTDAGINQVNQSSNAMEEIASNSDQTKAIVSELTNEIDKIKGIVTLINDISEQTNLLALNASIEAARAGEHGKGFSIVAEEVRKLAERSVDATDQIAKTVDQILAGVDQFTTQTETQATNIADESGKILAINKDFKQFAKNISDNIKMIDTINQHTQDISKSSEEIASAMEQATSTTESTTEHVVKMNDVISEQLKHAETINAEVADLKSSFHTH